MKKLVVLLLLITVFMCSAAGVVYAYAEETSDTAIAMRTETTKTVKVGYYNDEEKKFQTGINDSESAKSGYGYEYLQQITCVVDWVYEYDYSDSVDAALTKLAAGSVDIVAGVAPSKITSAMLCSEMDMGLPSDVYFAVKGSRTDLYNELNYAMAEINKANPMFTISLYQKYYSSTVEQILTEDEISWLNAKKKLTIGYISGNLPISDVKADGTPNGLINDLYVALDEFLPETVEVGTKVYNTVDELEKALTNGDIDIVFPMYTDFWLTEYKGFKQTYSIFSDKIMVIFRNNDGLNMYKRLEKIASSPRAIGQRMYVQSLYPNIKSNTVYYDDIDTAISKIRSKDADCVVGASCVLQRYWTSLEDTSGLTTSTLDKSASFSLAVRNDNVTLVSILDKYVLQVDVAEVTNSLAKYSAIEKPYTIGKFFRDNFAMVLTIILVTVAVIVFLMVLYIRKIRRLNIEQEKAYEIAQNANKAKTNFLSSMSHDIRTPMNAIVGMTTIAKKHLDDKERVKDCLQKITLSSDHLLTLINDVLDISKIESGKLTLSPVVFSLREAVTNLVNIVRPQITKKQLQFDVHVTNVEYEYLYADMLRVNQVFINILSNSVKYTPDGGKVVMDLHQEVLEKDKLVRLTYVVQDNGIGMSKEFMENMYEAFARAEDSRTSKIQGTGLGLAIVKQMVTLMGGTIDCESELDKGTKFTIVLDLPVGKKNDVQKLPDNIKMLVVDDDEIFLDSVQDVIVDLGAKVHTASSGAEAIEKVKKHGKEYSVVIVDWKMPGMSGFETIRNIRSMLNKDTPIILVSAYDWDDIEDEAKGIGVDGFISKPLFRSYIYEKLCSVLRLNETKDSVGPGNSNELSGIMLLVAEDNDLNWEVITELLDMYGIKSSRAVNGKECVDMMSAAKAGDYDLILMDVQMPVMDGKEATRALRASENTYIKNIPIIAMTADAFAEDVAACIEAGMNEHLAKPVDIDKLFQLVKKVLAAR